MTRTSPAAGSTTDRRRPVWIGAGFVAAFAATVATVVWTGLVVRAPGTADGVAEESSPAEQGPGPRRSPSADARSETQAPGPDSNVSASPTDAASGSSDEASGGLSNPASDTRPDSDPQPGAGLESGSENR